MFTFKSRKWGWEWGRKVLCWAQYGHIPPVWPRALWLIAKVAMIFHSSLGLCSSFHQVVESISPSSESWLNLSLALVLPECNRSDALSVPGPGLKRPHKFPFFLWDLPLPRGQVWVRLHNCERHVAQSFLLPQLTTRQLQEAELPSDPSVPPTVPYHQALYLSLYKQNLT